MANRLPDALKDVRAVLRTLIEKLPRLDYGINENTIPTCSVCRVLLQCRIPIPFCDLFSSSQRCTGGCALLWKAAMCFVAPEESRDASRVIGFYSYELSLFDINTWSVGQDDIRLETRRIFIYSASAKAYKLERLQINPPKIKRLVGTTSSPAVWSVVLAWLQECANDHTRERQSDWESARLPTRVLDLGTAPDEDVKIKLSETNGQHARYVCLSHCWGDIGCPLRTTSYNLASHKSDIPFGALPATFKDAVTFTRWLGVRYLWIDALCIVQDDESDWEQESGCMASIYEHSYMTLSADKAADSTKGLFSESERSLSQPEYMFEHAESDIRIFMRPSIPHSPIDGELGERVAHPSFPLLSRAWAFQERILSPRVLHFGAEELYWECQQKTYCECGHTGFARNWAKQEFRSMLRLPPGSDSSPSFALNRLAHWKRLVERYSQHQLSYPMDRLPAISGLAKRFGASMTGVKYLAGVWENDAIALVWHPEREIPEPEAPSSAASPSSYIAPTWSWASVDCAVACIRMGLEDVSFYKLLDSKCVAAGKDPTGRVSSGELVIEGRLERAIFTAPHQWSFPSSTMIWDDVSVRTHWDTTAVPSFSTDFYLMRAARVKLIEYFLILKPTGHVSAVGTGFYRVSLLKEFTSRRVPGQLSAYPSLFSRTETFTII